jgi:hypothetical protein
VVRTRFAFVLFVLSGCSPAPIDVFGCDIYLPAGFRQMEHREESTRYSGFDEKQNYNIIQLNRGPFGPVDTITIESRERSGKYDVIRYTASNSVEVLVIVRDDEHLLLLGDRAQEWGLEILEACP